MTTTLSFFASICAFACFAYADQPSPWEETPVYIVNDGRLYRVDALSSVSPEYVGYSIYYDQAGQAAGYTGDDWREAFAKGYYASRKTDNPLKPFERVTLPSPPDIVRQVQALPRFTMEKDYAHEPPPRCLMLPFDTYTTYWRRIDETLGMANSLGRVFFFPGKPGQERLVSWKGDGLVTLKDATPRPNKDGWLAVRYDGGREANALGWLHPVTGEFRAATSLSGDNVDLIRSAWLNADTVATSEPITIPTPLP